MAKKKDIKISRKPLPTLIVENHEMVVAGKKRTFEYVELTRRMMNDGTLGISAKEIERTHGIITRQLLASKERLTSDEALFLIYRVYFSSRITEENLKNLGVSQEQYYRWKKKEAIETPDGLSEEQSASLKEAISKLLKEKKK